MSRFSLSEFKPTIVFLAKFLGLYLATNLLYGLYITSFEPRPDPVTSIVSLQTAEVLSLFGLPVSSVSHETKPTVKLLYQEKAVLAVYEGCNGLNVAIIFVAFVLAFGPYTWRMGWFIPLGLFVIHIFNIGRLLLLFFVAEYMPRLMYFTHKYFFTAILYVVIFLMWLIWVGGASNRK